MQQHRRVPQEIERCYAALVIAEIELEDEDQAVDLPVRIGREVTGADQYHAARLARRPCTSWPEAERLSGG